MRFFGYELGRWLREGRHNRTRLIVHYLENGMRESYAAERQSEAAKVEAGKTPPPSAPIDFFQYRQGGGRA